MYSMILQDFRSHFRSSLRWVYDTDFSVCFIILIYCAEGMRKPDSYLGVTIPYIISLMLSRMYGGCMSKTFYLCPNDDKYRREYITKSIYLRILISLLIYVLVNVMLMLLGRITWVEFLVWMYFIICVSIAFNTFTRPKRVKTTYSTKKVYPVKGEYELWNFLIQFTGAITIILLAGYSVSAERWRFSGVISFLTISLLTVLMGKNYYKQVIDNLCFYSE